MTEKLTEKDYEILDACCELLGIKIDKLKAENEKLKEDNANKLSIVNKFLEENNMLKIYKDKYYQQTLDDEIKLNELYQILQEIKSIAERALAVCDDDCGNANKFKEIIELIKAEEE